MTCHMNISIGCIRLAQKRQISHSMKNYFLIVFLVLYNTTIFIGLDGLLKTGAQLENHFIHFIQVNFTSEKVRTKPHLFTQWAKVQVATYTQKMFNKIGNRCGWGKFERCLSDGQNELQVFFKPCSHWKFVRKKTAYILQCHQRFPHEMISEEQVQKFHPQTSFGKGTVESVAKCYLFSQVTEGHLI